MHLVSGARALSAGRMGLWPALIGDRPLILRIAAGGQFAPKVAEEPWRLCTSVFVHADLLHLALNATAIVALGRVLEPLVGSTRFAAWFAAGGLGGSLAAVLAGVRLSDGASGGAFALLGAAVVLGWRWRDRWDPEDRRLMGPILWAFLALNLVFSVVVPTIDLSAHLGGLAVGLLLGVLPDGRGVRAAEALGLGLFLGACAWGWTRP